MGTATAMGTARAMAMGTAMATGKAATRRDKGTVQGTARSSAGHNGRIARLPFTRRLGPIGTALLFWDLWRRLPPRQRRWVAKQARAHGPRLAKQALDAQRRRGPKR
jgi:hypothetical protein